MKSIVRRTAFVIAAASIAAVSLFASNRFATAAEPSTTESKTAEGFKSLFNGKDLSGWSGLEGFWSVKDGAISGAEDKQPRGSADVSDLQRQVLRFRIALQIQVRHAGRQLGPAIPLESHRPEDKPRRRLSGRLRRGRRLRRLDLRRSGRRRRPRHDEQSRRENRLGRRKPTPQFAALRNRRRIEKADQARAIGTTWCSWPREITSPTRSTAI